MRSSSSPKIISLSDAPGLRASWRAEGRKVVLSHGVFDLVDSGFVDHLEEAGELGDILVVTVVADTRLSNGPARPCFHENLRARTLAALACVDYVIVVPFAAAAETIAWLGPDVYCKGKEHEPTEGITPADLEEERIAVEKLGAELRYVGSTAFTSASLLRAYLEHLDAPVKEFCRTLAKTFSVRDLREAMRQFAELSVLVVGDSIFDRYSYVKVQGLTSKNRIISGRFLSEEMQCGGALAVFRHVKQFTNRVRFVSLVGTEPWVEPILGEHIAPEQDRVVREEKFTTVVKQRFVEPLGKGKELSKLFSVNHIDAAPPSRAVQEKLRTRLLDEIRKVDLVLLLDFGHGLLQPEIRELIQESAPFLALNCQTNSNNHGFNIISRQYRRADAFSLDEQELLLSVGHRHIDYAVELETLRQQLTSDYAWLTRGPVETLGQHAGEDCCQCPPFENDVVDTIGAGDAFFSVAALAAARKLPVAAATFLGQLAGAQAVKIVGNSSPISKALLVETGCSLLSDSAA